MTTFTELPTNKYWNYALLLAFFSIFFGFSVEVLTIFGFGIDSFIEVTSGNGILAMVIRIHQNPDTLLRSQFEKTALRITGTAFYLLVIGLAVTAIYNIVVCDKPEITPTSLIISVISIAIMWALLHLPVEFTPFIPFTQLE